MRPTRALTQLQREFTFPHKKKNVCVTVRWGMLPRLSVVVILQCT